MRFTLPSEIQTVYARSGPVAGDDSLFTANSQSDVGAAWPGCYNGGKWLGMVFEQNEAELIVAPDAKVLWITSISSEHLMVTMTSCHPDFGTKI